jgi:tRNA(Glu) U13 pseudouridine synthase TruD
MNEATQTLLKQNLELYKGNLGIPNYFDSQKFGFIGGPEGLFASKFLQNDYEGALKLIIANPNRKQRPSAKNVHKFLRDNWGDWNLCTQFLNDHNFDNYLELTQYLEQNPGEFLGTIKLLTPEIIKLKVTALQAFLWNEYVKKELERLFSNMKFQGVKYHVVGTLLFIKEPNNVFEALKSSDDLHSKDFIESTLPLPSFELENNYLENYNALLKKYFGLNDISEFKKFTELGYVTNAFSRKISFSPSNLIIEDEGQDRNIKKEKNRYCTISFELPPGAYATVLIKALCLA